MKLNSKNDEELYLIDEFVKPFEDHQVSCPICKSNTDWQISRNIGIISSKDHQDLIGYPVVPVICDNCGYTLFANPSRKVSDEKSESVEEEEVSKTEDKKEDEEALSKEVLELAKSLQEIFNVLHNND